MFPSASPTQAGRESVYDFRRYVPAGICPRLRAGCFDACGPSGLYSRPAKRPRVGLLNFAVALAVAGAAGFIALSYEILWYSVISFANWGLPGAFGLPSFEVSHGGPLDRRDLAAARAIQDGAASPWRDIKNPFTFAAFQPASITKMAQRIRFGTTRGPLGE